MNTHPKFSVITPSFNQGAYIEKTIDSVLSQGYPNLEYIIVDGGSNDGTVEIIKKYERHLTYWVSEKDRGQSHAINKGFSRSTGQYLTWLNSDDYYVSEALARFAELAVGDDAAGLIVGAGRMVDQTGTCLTLREPPQRISLETLYNWFEDGYFVQPSSIFSRAAWEACGPLAEDEHIAMDLDLWLKIVRAGFNVITTNDVLAEALIHPDAKTTAFKCLMEIEGLLVIGKHGGAAQMKNGMLKISRRLDDSTKRLEWYERNYEIIVNHPMIKFIRPIVKRLGREGTYWQSKVPPWVK